MPLKNNRHRWDDALARVDATRFEALIADHYRAEGWSVEHVGAGHVGTEHDGGIDLKLRRAGEYVVVQCKRWNANQVTHNPVHELIGVMITQGATGAVVVTCGEFTRAAIDAARKEPRMRLVDGYTVREWIDVSALEAEAARSTATGATAADEWANATSQSRARRTRDRTSPGASLPAIIATAVAVAFLVFVLQGRPTTPPETRRVGLSPPPPATPSAAPARRVGLSPPLPVEPRSSPAPTPMPASMPTTTPSPEHTTRAAPALEQAGHLKPLADTVNTAATAYLRQAGMPDTRRPIDREGARQAARTLDGVRSAFWIDHDNFMVMVDGSERRSMAMIDEVCIALQPLGDTLAVVVNLQDITAQNPDGATTLSRNCQLPEGQRALFQRKRQVDVVDPGTRAVFKDQQGEK